MNSPSDQELIRSYCQTGSDAAFATLVERHIDLVYSAAVRMVVDHHLAEDVTQAVFSALSQNATKLSRQVSLSGWLHATARHQAAALVRGEVRRRARERNAADMNSYLPDPQPTWKQLEPHLDDALSELPHADRDVILLRFFERKTAREIGECFRWSEEAAQKRVRRALERLRRVLARRGLASSASSLAGMLGLHGVLSAPTGLAATVAGQAVGLGTAAVVTSISGVTDFFFAFMVMKKWIVIGTALLAGVAIAPLVLQQTSRAPRVTVQFDPATPPAATATNSRVETTLDWTDIESTDYRQFIANLRASGAPERLIRDVVGLEIYRLYLPRIREIWGQNGMNRPYWHKQVEGLITAEQATQLGQALLECRAVLASLFGPEARVQEALNVITCQPDFQALRLAWLPRDVETKAAAILEVLQHEEAGQGKSQEEWSETQQRLERKLNALKGVLTTEQLEEFRMREHQHGLSILGIARYCDLSEQEYKKLVNAGDPGLLLPGATIEKQHERQRQLTKLVGSERATELLKAADPTYVCAQDAANASGLAPDVPDRAWRSKWEAIAEYERLMKNEHLQPADRKRQVEQLLARTQRTLIDLLGTNGFRLARQDPWWEIVEKP